MKVKVIDKSLGCYDMEFKVLKMNYDDIVVSKGDERYHFKRDEVKFISECNSEDILIECKDIIKIKLDRGMSLLVYTKLVCFIEDKINGKIKGINVLKDEYRVIRRGLWEKKLFLVINEETPLEVSVIGTNFSNKFDITIKDIELERFVEGCLIEIKEMEDLIKQKKDLSLRYKKALQNVVCSRIDTHRTPVMLK